MQLHIPEPCHVNWHDMTPQAGGRHCAQCAKTVIDFTGMTAEEISVYLQLQGGTKICGRFTEDQLKQNIPTPQEYVLNVLRAPLPFLKQIAALIIFVLFIGAGPAVAQTQQRVQHTQTTILGAPPQQPSRVVIKKAAHPPKDSTVKCQRPVMGKVAPMPPILEPGQQPEPVQIMGDVDITPQPQLQNIITGGVSIQQVQQQAQPKKK